MWFVILVVLVIVCVWFVKGDVKYKPQYKTYQSIIDTLKSAGFEIRDWKSSRGEVQSDIIFNNQCVGSLHVSTSLISKDIMEIKRDKAVKQIGEAALGNFFDMAYCHHGTLAYWSTLPDYLTREMANEDMTNMRSGAKETAAWLDGSVDATEIVFKFMK